jgi:hypothetical protein
MWARIGQKRNAYKNFVGNTCADYMQDIDVDKRIILKYVLQLGEGVGLDHSWSEYGPLSRFCEHGTEIFNFLEWGEAESTWYCGHYLPIVQPRMIDDGDCGAIHGMKIGRGNRSTWRKPAPAPRCPPQIPHYLTRSRTWAYVVGSQRLTVLAIGRVFGFQTKQRIFVMSWLKINLSRRNLPLIS